MNLFVTVFTDASYCPATRAYGWAGWVKYGEPPSTDRISGRGVGVQGSSYAEKIALQKCIKHMIEGDIVRDKVVILQSDCIGVLNTLDLLPLYEAGAEYVKTKHVKAHRGVACPRSAVNTWCDREARIQMRMMRKELGNDEVATNVPQSSE